MEPEAVQRAGHAVEHVLRLHHARPAAVVVHRAHRHADDPRWVQPVRVLAAVVHLHHESRTVRTRNETTLKLEAPSDSKVNKRHTQKQPSQCSAYLAVLEALQRPRGRVRQEQRLYRRHICHAERVRVNHEELAIVDVRVQALGRTSACMRAHLGCRRMRTGR